MVFQHFRFLAPASPHKYPSHLPSKVFRLHFSISDHFFHDFSENVLPARVVTTILDIGAQHIKANILLFRPRNGGDKAYGHDFRIYRCVARSFPIYPLHDSQAGPQKKLLLQVANTDRNGFGSAAEAFRLKEYRCTNLQTL